MSESQTVPMEVLQQILAEQAKQNAANLEAVIRTIKEPTVLEQKTLDKQAAEAKAANEARQKTAKEVLQGIQNKRWLQSVCSHAHNDAAHGTHLVFVQEKTGPGYLICQKNQCVIRPGLAPKGYQGTAQYNTALFNQLFQTLPGRGEIFG
jgi:hypothetical protein